MFPTMQVTKRSTSEKGVISMFWAAKIPTPTGIAPRSSINGTMETKKEISSALDMWKIIIETKYSRQ